MKRDSDDTLVEAYRRGDKAAAELIVRRYADRLHRYLHRLCGPDDAHDLLQETFMQFFRRIDAYEARGKLAAYLYRIATSRARDRLRGLGRSAASGDLTVLGDSRQDPARRALAREDRTLVRRAVDELAPQQREVLVLATYEGLAYEDIARTVGCSLGAVKQRLFRARATLRQRLLPWVTRGRSDKDGEGSHAL